MRSSVNKNNNWIHVFKIFKDCSLVVLALVLFTGCAGDGGSQWQGGFSSRHNSGSAPETVRQSIISDTGVSRVLLSAPQAVVPPPPIFSGQWQGPQPGPPPTAPCERPTPRAVAGDPPASGLRHWAEPFNKLAYEVEELGNSYLSVTLPPSGEVELWANEWGPDSSANRTIFVRRGPAIDKLSSKEIMFDGTLIDDVYALDGSGDLAPTRGFTRPYMTYTPEDGYVLLCCVCPDYLPGRTYLLPALVASKTGKPGTWRYLGMLKKRGQPEN
jgi:hypothetical protein